MFSFFNKRRILCPYCLVEIRGNAKPSACPQCKTDLPIQYVEDYDENPPFFAQVFGWSQVGKTVFQGALTLMLVKMSKVWPNFACSAATNASLIRVREINEYLSRGRMPPMTSLGPQEVYIMLLRNMERWRGRTLVMRDCAGEIFDDLEVPLDQAPFLLNAPTAFMLISLHDLPSSGGRSMDQLLNSYINTLMKHGVDLRKQRRKLIVVLTKADMIPDLPGNLRQYLAADPIWAAVNTRESVPPMDGPAMQRYMDAMERVSDTLRSWIAEDAAGNAFLQLARSKNIDLRFTAISSTGADVTSGGLTSLTPRRVLDPYFWALELQSA